MKPGKIAIIPKITKVEWDMRRLKLSKKELIEFYKKRNLNVDEIINSHNRQKNGLEKINQLLEGCKLIQRDELTKEKLEDIKLVISFGGDNHFQYVSHFLEDIPILGINSDPSRSEGSLTSFSPKEFEEILPSILKDNFEAEKWTRIETSIDGKKLAELSIGELYIGEEKRFKMSRYILTHKGVQDEQKGSGLIITTGAGSSGWYGSAARFLFPNGNSFPKTKKEARFLLTEPFSGRVFSSKLVHGSLIDDEEIEIISLSNSQAFLSVDSLALYQLKEGALIKIKLGNPLKVIESKGSKK